jgi:hypothetical protein
MHRSGRLGQPLIRICQRLGFMAAWVRTMTALRRTLLRPPRRTVISLPIDGGNGLSLRTFDPVRNTGAWLDIGRRRYPGINPDIGQFRAEWLTKASGASGLPE